MHRGFKSRIHMTHVFTLRPLLCFRQPVFTGLVGLSCKKIHFLFDFNRNSFFLPDRLQLRNRPIFRNDNCSEQRYNTVQFASRRHYFKTTEIFRILFAFIPDKNDPTARYYKVVDCSQSDYRKFESVAYRARVAR